MCASLACSTGGVLLMAKLKGAGTRDDGGIMNIRGRGGENLQDPFAM